MGAFRECRNFNADLSKWVIAAINVECTYTFFNCGIDHDHKPKIFNFIL